MSRGCKVRDRWTDVVRRRQIEGLFEEIEERVQIQVY